MRLCFIVEERYRDEGMPLEVAEQLLRWGHDVDLLEPQATVTGLTELAVGGRQPYDAWVLKTVSDGPGISLLEAVAATGAVTINHSRAIRLVRDKAVAAAHARVHGLPFPLTYFVTHRRLLEQIPPHDYPLVVKPSNGSQGRAVRLLRSPADLAGLDLEGAEDCFLLAQRYAPNSGDDIKLYNTGRSLHAVERPSPLSDRAGGPDRVVPLTAELRDLALAVGRVFGLDIYGVDVVRTGRGWVAVDVNDFPSFGQVADAPAVVAESILHIAQRAAVARRHSRAIRGEVRPRRRRGDLVGHAAPAPILDAGAAGAVGGVA